MTLHNLSHRYFYVLTYIGFEAMLLHQRNITLYKKEWNFIQVITEKLPCMELKGSWRCNTRIPNELIVVCSRYVYTSDVNQKKQTNKTFVQL